MATRTGTCMCGGLIVQCADEPIRVSMCHCIACQKRTGSVFGTQARYPRGAVKASGAEKTYVRVGDAGASITYHFCSACGTTVYWEIDALPDFIAVAVGAFGDRAFPAPSVSVYDARRHPWTDMPELDLEVWD